MRSLVRFLRRKSETYHMVIHVLLGVWCAYATTSFFPQASFVYLLLFGILGSILPDVDHLIYFLFYGKHSPYSQAVKSFLKNMQFRYLWGFISINHKNNTGLYSHNLFSVILAGLAFWYFEAVKDRPSLTVFFLSWTVHYLFDITEDILFFKRLNPNWYLRFNKPRRGAQPPDLPSFPQRPPLV